MSGQSEPNEFLQVFLEEAVDILSDWERHCLALQAQNSPDTLSALFRAAHNLKGSARSVGLGEYGKFIHKAEDLIVLLRDGRLLPDSSNIRALLDAHSVLSQWRDQLLSDDKYVPRAAIAHTEDLLISLARTDKSQSHSFHGLDSSAAASNEGFGFFDDPIETAAVVVEPIALVKHETPKAPAARANESIRIPASRIDGLMQLIGELSIQQSTILYGLRNNELSEKTYHKAIHMAAKLTRELQLQTMGLRLTDIGRLFQKLERTARDLAVDQGKNIRIELQGSEVELDKNVIERVSDALVHMVRNAVDHGIESPADRASKSAEAVIRISAFQSAAGVTILIEDDGHGIDQARVLKKALSLGLTKDGAKLLPSQIYDFMFAPGFSTAAKVTEVSGRGVGLDVVKRTITDLGGSLEITSEVGKGTSFAISLPLTVSIVDALIIVSGGQSYVVPIQEISEVIDMRGFAAETQFKKSQTISLREKALNVLSLQTFLPLKNSALGASSDYDKPNPVMVVEFEGQKIGLSFEKIVGQQPILIRQLADYIANVPGFSGNTVLANGEPAIILSPKVFAQQYFSKRSRAS